MKTNACTYSLLFLLTIFASSAKAAPAGTAFCYQGQLKVGSIPADGLYDYSFQLYTDSTATSGFQVGPTLTSNAVFTKNGAFEVVLDFGSNFPGQKRWLQIAVKTNGVNTYTELLPRQELLPTPYAMTASNAIVASSATSLSGSLAGDVTGTQSATTVSSVGGQTAANVASGASAANNATSANTVSAIVRRDAAGNFSAGTITASLSGNASSATSFSGSLAGDVTGTQSATTIASVGGQTAANVASGASAANNATSANTANTIVRRDASGNFSAGALTLAGNLTLVSGGSISSPAGTSLIHYTGTHNFFAGQGAGNNSVTGGYNTGTGYGALSAVTSGTQNTAIGHQPLYHNTTGSDNTAVGYAGLVNNATGKNNTGLGSFALSQLGLMGATASNNTAVGYGAISGAQDTSGNTAVGFGTLGGGAGLGNNNIALGNRAGSNINGSNNIAIGSAGAAYENGIIRIGTPNTHTNAKIAGIYGTTVSGGTAVYVDSYGTLGTTTSSRRFKEDIKPMGAASEVLLALRPVTFRYNSDAAALPQFGLIAEEVEQTDPGLVIHDQDGLPYSVRYEQVNAMLLNEFLKEHRKVEELERARKAAEARMAALEAAIAELKAAVAKDPSR